MAGSKVEFQCHLSLQACIWPHQRNSWHCTIRSFTETWPLPTRWKVVSTASCTKFHHRIATLKMPLAESSIKRGIPRIYILQYLAGSYANHCECISCLSSSAVWYSWALVHMIWLFTIYCSWECWAHNWRSTSQQYGSLKVFVIWKLGMFPIQIIAYCAYPVKPFCAYQSVSIHYHSNMLEQICLGTTVNMSSQVNQQADLTGRQPTAYETH